MSNLIQRLVQSHISEDETIEFHRKYYVKIQRLAFQCCLDIEKLMRPGMTERQVATLMDTYLKDYGVRNFFHTSFAWFGERTRFEKFSNYFHFLPSSRELKENDIFILDTAPVLEGYVGDVGWTSSLISSEELKKARTYLNYLRRQLPLWVMEMDHLEDVWKHVNNEMLKEGWDNCHRQYPFSVLGHRVRKMKGTSLPMGLRPFSMQAYVSLISHGLFGELLTAHHRGPRNGFWAIEPHLGGNLFGAKFEEILVIENSKAYWLDDSVPHLQTHL